MKKKLLLLSALLLLLLPTGVVLAQSGDRTVPADESVLDDVVLFNESLTIEAGGYVAGDVAVFNGSATVAGEVAGDLVVINGSLELTETAVVNGECVVLNGSVIGSRSASCIQRDMSALGALGNFAGLNNASSDGVAVSSGEATIAGLFAAIAVTIITTIFVTAASLGVQAGLPTQTARIEQAMRQRPFATSTVGFLTLFAVPFIGFVLMTLSSILILACGIGLLGFPVVLAIVIGFMMALVWSWVVWGKLISQRLARMVGWCPSSPMLLVGLGTAVLTFVMSLIAFSSVPGFVLMGLALLLPMSVGMGATALTRFGTRDFPHVALAEPAIDSDKETAVLSTLPPEEF